MLQVRVLQSKEDNLLVFDLLNRGNSNLPLWLFMNNQTILKETIISCLLQITTFILQTYLLTVSSMACLIHLLRELWQLMMWITLSSTLCTMSQMNPKQRLSKNLFATSSDMLSTDAVKYFAGDNDDKVLWSEICLRDTVNTDNFPTQCVYYYCCYVVIPWNRQMSSLIEKVILILIQWRKAIQFLTLNIWWRMTTVKKTDCGSFVPLFTPCMLMTSLHLPDYLISQPLCSLLHKMVRTRHHHHC